MYLEQVDFAIVHSSSNYMYAAKEFNDLMIGTCAGMYAEVEAYMY